MTLHRLKPIEVKNEDLAVEVERLVQEIVRLIGGDLIKVIQFGSSLGGTAAMHQYSDVDLCVVMVPTASPKSYFGKLPISKLIPVDWILVNKDEFDEKSAKRHGVFHLVNTDGKILWDNANGKI